MKPRIRNTDAPSPRPARKNPKPVVPALERARLDALATAHVLGKEIHWTPSGASVELEESVLSSLGDVLVQLVRNAIDHGIESPEVRVAAGKARSGVIRVALQEIEEGIEILVADDGAGIDPHAVVAAAVKAGVITLVRPISREEAFALLFVPGFSTRQTASEISGRGIGLDVVRDRLDTWGARISIETELGTGTTFRVFLPHAAQTH